MRGIVCIGSRLHEEDAAGPLIYDRLRECPLPEGVALVEGGLAGLDLIRFVDGWEEAIFVDTVDGFGPAGCVRLLEAGEIAACAGGHHDHAAGLPYLLRMLPAVCEGQPPRVRVVGIEGPLTDALLEEAEALVRKMVGAGPGDR